MYRASTARPALVLLCQLGAAEEREYSRTTRIRLPWAAAASCRCSVWATAITEPRSAEAKLVGEGCTALTADSRASALLVKGCTSSAREERVASAKRCALLTLLLVLAQMVMHCFSAWSLVVLPLYASVAPSASTSSTKRMLSGW
jgi:hypothetical protein